MAPTQAILDACDGRTRAVTLCHVESSTGYRHDLAAIGAFCREHGIWLAVDAVHSVGVLPVNVEEMKVDFLCGSDYKWMMNFCGVGYAYVSPALRAVLKQRGAGWLSVKQLFATGLFEADLADGASRYEMGYPFAPGIFTMGEVASRYLALGKRDVEEYVLSLAQYFYDSVRGRKDVSILSEYGRGHDSALASIAIPARYGVTEKKLLEKGVAVTVHEGHLPEQDTVIRASCHYVNTREDIDRLVGALGELMG